MGVSRLGHRSAFIGRVGGDGFGAAIVRRLGGEGVDVSALVVDSTRPTGLLVRERRTLGPSDVLYHRAGSAGSQLSPDDVGAGARLFERARWLHVTGITPALSLTCREAVSAAFELAAAHGLIVSLDLNIRRKLWSEEQAASVLRELVPRSDVVFAAPDEAAVVTGDAASDSPEVLGASLVSLGTRVAVMKLAEEGALEVRRGEPTIHREALRVPQVVDAVGAGDAFAAGYIAATLEGVDAVAVLDLANACGASAIASIGDLTGLPTRAEAERVLASSMPGESVR